MDISIFYVQKKKYVQLITPRQARVMTQFERKRKRRCLLNASTCTSSLRLLLTYAAETHVLHVLVLHRAQPLVHEGLRGEDPTITRRLVAPHGRGFSFFRLETESRCRRVLEPVSPARATAPRAFFFPRLRAAAPPRRRPRRASTARRFPRARTRDASGRGRVALGRRRRRYRRVGFLLPPRPKRPGARSRGVRRRRARPSDAGCFGPRRARVRDIPPVTSPVTSPAPGVPGVPSRVPSPAGAGGHVPDLGRRSPARRAPRTPAARPRPRQASRTRKRKTRRL